MSTLTQPYGIRNIIDYAAKTHSEFFVINPRSADHSFWIQSERLPSLLHMTDGVVAVMDSVDKEENVKTKEVYRDGNTLIFFVNEELSGTISLDMLRVFASAYEQAPREVNVADTDRSSEVQRRIAAMKNSSQVKRDAAPDAPASSAAR